MKRLQLRHWTPNLNEIHEYTLDLQRITMLRDKTTNEQERGRYDICIDVMQEVLIFLNARPKNTI
jgi:hypothetical protein